MKKILTILVAGIALFFGAIFWAFTGIKSKDADLVEDEHWYRD